MVPQILVLRSQLHPTPTYPWHFAFYLPVRRRICPSPWLEPWPTIRHIALGGDCNIISFYLLIPRLFFLEPNSPWRNRMGEVCLFDRGLEGSCRSYTSGPTACE